MWEHLAYFIIRFRLSLIAVLAVITVFMAWKAKDVEMTYDFAQVVSPKDPDMVYFQQFKQTFGEDGNVLVLGLQDSSRVQAGQLQRVPPAHRYPGQSAGRERRAQRDASC